MIDTILVLVGVMVLLGIDVLIGLGLHTRNIDRQYRRLAQRVRHLNAREAALHTRGSPTAVCGSCPLELLRGMLLSERLPSGDED